MQVVFAQGDEDDLGLVEPYVLLEARYYTWMNDSPVLRDIGFFSSIPDVDITSPSIGSDGQSGKSGTASPVARGGQSDGESFANSPSNSASPFAEEDAAKARPSLT